jgi:hypothetical protein
MKSYLEWRKEVTKEYQSEDPQFEVLDSQISDAMIADGPDGHTDGSNLIASYILEVWLKSE